MMLLLVCSVMKLCTVSCFCATWVSLDEQGMQAACYRLDVGVLSRFVRKRATAERVAVVTSVAGCAMPAAIHHVCAKYAMHAKYNTSRGKLQTSGLVR
jgi:hypothetical protein